jgi:hypothetical protein
MGSIKELEGLKYTEYININNGLKILQNKEDIINNLPEKRKKKILEKAKNFDPFISLHKMCKDKNNMIYTSYKFSKNLQDHGRLFADNASLQGLPREFRNALSQGLYWDIDMKNAHPTLLSQYCKKNGIRCDVLEEYIENRDAILETLCADNEMDKSDAKTLFLSILNGNEGGYLNSEFLNKYRTEIKQIHKQIIALNPDDFKKIKNRKAYNPEGSMMNVILCKLEHNILMNAVLYFRQQGFNVDVLIFDGFMVRKEEGKEITEETLSNLSKFVKDNTSYDITFVEKSIDNLIDLSKYVEPLLDDKPVVSYFKDKELFEKTHLKIKHPINYISILENDEFDYQSEDKIKASYKHQKSTILNERGKIEKVSFIQTWLNDEHIRVYERMVFVPPPAKYNTLTEYNTWKTFPQEKTPLPPNFDVNTNKYVKIYKEFIYNLMNGDTQFINYYDAWCANIIQYPAKRSCVCLVLYSLFEGVGKNMSTRTLELCVGEIYTNYITDVGNQLFGKHSSAELNKLLIVLNEVKGKDTYSNTDLFKTRITDPKREVELKNKDTIQTTNYCSYILNTNNINAVNAGDKDRRFCVIPCINKKIDDKKYFDEYEKQINENPEAIRCIYEYLKTYDIEKVIPDRIFAAEGVRPKSDLYKELQECNREKEWDFLEKIVYENVDSAEYIVTMDNMWVKFKNFCANNNYDISKIPSKRFHYIFSQQVITFLDNKAEYKDTIIKDRNASSRYYKFNIQKLKKYFNIEE